MNYRCLRCNSELTTGLYGPMICPTCRQIEAIEKQTQSMNQSSYSGGGYSGLTAEQMARKQTFVTMLYLGIFLYVAHLGNWFLLKFTWMLFKVGCWFMLGWWMGFDFPSGM
jgi:hypothetical protein